MTNLRVHRPNQVCTHEQSGEGEQRMSRIGSVSTLTDYSRCCQDHMPPSYRCNFKGSMNIPALEVGVSLVHNMPGCMVLPLPTQQQWSTWRCSYFFNSSRKLKVYFLFYEYSTGVQKFESTIRWENEAFESLIRQKSLMMIPVDQDGRCIGPTVANEAEPLLCHNSITRNNLFYLYFVHCGL
ncbi:uncharacterized protein [Miscanthus floridulus]|uniref:uncharacterized protein isoform X2 n=1 Tax=Miscanthus floridulus TaxID=154761 RepID=UPI0034579504